MFYNTWIWITTLIVYTNTSISTFYIHFIQLRVAGGLESIPAAIRLETDVYFKYIQIKYLVIILFKKMGYWYSMFLFPTQLNSLKPFKRTTFTTCTPAKTSRLNLLPLWAAACFSSVLLELQCKQNRSRNYFHLRGNKSVTTTIWDDGVTLYSMGRPVANGCEAHAPALSWIT